METENAIEVQIALGIMLLSWPVALIVVALNAGTTLELDGWAVHVFSWPLVLVALMTLNGTPQREVKREKAGIDNG